MTTTRRHFLALAAGGAALRGQSWPAGLPDVLTNADGEKITTVAGWRRRRAGILELFTREMYGRDPGRPKGIAFTVVERSTPALGGTALRKQVNVSFASDPRGPRMALLLYLPRAPRRPAPAILGMNFWGNQTVSSDPGIRLSDRWVESGRNPFLDLSCVSGNRATEACRGINAWVEREFMAAWSGADLKLRLEDM